MRKIILNLFLILLFFTSALLVYQSFLVNAKVEGTEKEVKVIASNDFPIEILNATYSATPVVNEKVTTTKPASNVQQSGYLTSKGNELNVLVNKSIALPASYVPTGLVSVGGYSTNPNAKVRSISANYLFSMLNDAKAAGYTIVVTSAYRSYYEQVATFNQWVKLAGLAAAESFSARAGHSQHQLGTTVDVSSSSVGYKLSESFGTTAEGVWLAANAYKYGFALSYPAGKEAITGYAYEPWHFRFLGLAHAAKMRELGLDMETYLQKYGVW